MSLANGSARKRRRVNVQSHRNDDAGNSLRGVSASKNHNNNKQAKPHLEPASAEPDSGVLSNEDSGSREDDDLSEANSHDQFSDVSEASDEEDHEVRKQKDELRTLPFGVLADAQDALPTNGRRRRTSSNAAPAADGDKDQKLQSLRDRLAELREKKTGKTPSKAPKQHGTQGMGPHQRESKHAPGEQSSTRQVTRRRQVIDTSHLHDAHSLSRKLQGDPRFNAASGGVDSEKLRKNYSFLNDYAQTELKDLKASLVDGKKRKRGKLTEEEEVGLKREIVRRENRTKAEAQKYKEREIASKHKKEERQKVKEGKTPFYMKRGQIKEQARQEEWDGMKKKDKEKAEQKRKRRHEAKEMKRKPPERRLG